MANIESALKRTRQNVKRAAHNRKFLAKAKGSIKAVTKAIGAGKKDELMKLLNTSKKTLLSVASKGIIHKNTASRKMSRLQKKVNTFLKSAR